jgi:hypothetical protein
MRTRRKCNQPRVDSRPLGGRQAVILRDQSGVTVVELIMATLIGLVVLGATWGVVAVQGRSAAFQSGLADAQSSSRGAGTLLIQDLRMAGFGMLGVPSQEDLPPLEYEEAAGTTSLVLRGAFGGVRTTLKLPATAGSTNLTIDPPTMGTFVVGERVLVDSGLGAEVRTLTAVGASTGELVLSLDSPLTRSYPIGPNVTQLEEISYAWSGSILERDGQVLADRVSAFDLQFIDADGVVADEPGNSIRAVRLEMVMTDPAALPDGPPARAGVSTEINVRNLAFRFELG